MQQQDPLEISTHSSTSPADLSPAAGEALYEGDFGPDAAPYPSAREPDRERGATLMFALAILALLVLFSTVFARLMSIERRASAYYRDRVRSKLAARAGIERAIVELRAVAGQNHYSDPYAGGWKYFANTGTRPTGLPNNEAVDLLTTTYPSFRQQHPDPAITRWGETLTYSGYLGQPDDLSHMVYRLKILDSGSQLNLNNPDQRTANRLLKNLLYSTFLDANDGTGLSPADDPDLDLSQAQAKSIADLVIPLRTGGTTGDLIEQVEDRFRSKPQLGAAIIEAAVTVGITRTLIESEWAQHLRDKVTVYSWEDPDVIRPYRLNVGDGDPGDPPSARRSLSLMARAPVNLNTASAPVLYALFAELAAHNRYGTFEIKRATAQALAAAIIARRNDPTPGGSATGFNPFKSWPEFEAWLDAPAQDGIFATADGSLAPALETPWTRPLPDKLAWPGGLDWSPAGGLIALLHADRRIGQRDLIKSMLNPNTMLNKYGAMPTHGGYQRRYAKIVDKSDIVRMTTEGCFDSLGVFEITSTGLIVSRDVRNTDRGYMVSAGHTDLVVVRVYTPFRLTTQSQFEKHRANMIQGNFIDSPERLYKDPPPGLSTGVVDYGINDAFSASVNQAAYFDNSVPVTDYNHMAPGWPGMVSWPQYSLKRVNTALGGTGTNRFPMYDSANPATWDGNLTLSNMITVRTGDNDFVAGFSRGKLEAFKVRAWWEAKDIQASGQYRLDGSGVTVPPTRPANTDELAYLAKSLTRDDQAPALVGASGLESVLAEEFTDVGVVDSEAVRMFTEGTQLVNTGVMIGPDRFSVDPSGNKVSDRFLAYDSNNIDLRQGTSIRFWVQPLLDPASRDREVLFYFNGSNGSEVAGGGTTPNNRAVDPLVASLPVPAGYHNGGATTDDQVRHGNKHQAGFLVVKEWDFVNSKVVIKLEDLGSGIYSWSQGGVMSIDVTPSYFTGTPTAKPDPAQPEWIPGSWHWIVINFGPGQANAGARRRAFATLQVDKQTPAVHGLRLFQRGDGVAVGDKNTTKLGEVHAYRDEHSVSAISNFVSAVDATNSQGGQVYHRTFPRLLGDFYHCTQHDPLSKEAAQAQNGAATYGPGTISYRREYEYGGDINDSPVIRWVGGPWKWYPFVANAGDPPPGSWQRVAGMWPDSPFPGLCTDRKMELRFRTPLGGGVGSPPTSLAVDFLSGGWTPAYPDKKVNFPSPFGWDSDSGPPPGAVVSPADENWPYPGGSQWHQSVMVSWDEVHYRGRSPWAANPWPSAAAPGWLPADLAELDMVDHPPRHDPVPNAVAGPYEHRGGRLPYALDSSGRHSKNTAMTTDPASVDPLNPDALPLLVQSPYASYIRSRSSLTFGTGGAAWTVPLDAVDDDCHGCEDCDVDGPVIFGAEPMGNFNYNGTRVADPNPNTMATAVFDNIVFVNQDPDRRTDFPNITNGGDLVSGTTVSLVGKDFEDRFYEEDLAQFLDSVAGAGAKGTGAVFHRGLLELRNRRFRLSSMTWTSYPTQATGLDFELALWKINNDVDPTDGPVYRYGNADLINAERDTPSMGDFSTPTNFARDPTIGGVFGHPDFGVRKLSFLTNFFQPDPLPAPALAYTLRSPFVDGLGSVAAGRSPELLILGVRLQGYTNDHLEPGDAGAGDPGVLVSPVLETPVFEDVTLNLTFPRPQYLYAEEGAIE